jgi:hypothetical protein
MSDRATNSGESTPQRKVKDYEDPHYHDEDVEDVPSDETERRTHRTRGRRKVNRGPPPWRHYEDYRLLARHVALDESIPPLCPWRS